MTSYHDFKKFISSQVYADFCVDVAGGHGMRADEKLLFVQCNALQPLPEDEMAVLFSVCEMMYCRALQC